MRIAITGGTGFIGRYIVRHLINQGHECRCWSRTGAPPAGFADVERKPAWIAGTLGDVAASAELVRGCDAVVHAALYHPGGGFREGEGELIEFVQANVVGTLQLIEAARAAAVGRFVFVSSCAVHDKILDDRPLDEKHPTWSTSHYGAHKAAIESFVHSYGWGQGYPICALRPTGVYGIEQPVEQSKWFALVRAVVRGEQVTCRRGGKEVHAADVAKAVGILLTANGIAGESFNCYDRYVSEFEVATFVKQRTGGSGAIHGAASAPKHQIVTDKLRSLGMQFGGTELLEQTLEQLIGLATT